MKRILLAVAVTAMAFSATHAEAGQPVGGPDITAEAAYGEYCVYYWCDGEWHSYATYSTKCQATRAALNLQAKGYRTYVARHD